MTLLKLIDKQNLLKKIQNEKRFENFIDLKMSMPATFSRKKSKKKLKINERQKNWKNLFYLITNSMIK